MVSQVHRIISGTYTAANVFSKSLRPGRFGKQVRGDEASGEVILVGVGLTPAGPLSPPIAIALIIEGILRGE